MSKHHKHKFEAPPVAWNVVVKSDPSAYGPTVEIVLHGFAVDSTAAAIEAVSAKQHLLAAGHAVTETADLGSGQPDLTQEQLVEKLVEQPAKRGRASRGVPSTGF